MLFYTWLLIIGLTTGVAMADDDDDEDDCCSAEDKKEVAFMWHQVWHTSHSDRKVAIMKAVFHEVIEKHPEVKDRLKALGIEDEEGAPFRAYVIRVTHGVDNLINLLDDPQILEEQIHYLSDKFGDKLDNKKTYFEAVVEAFEEVLPKISTCFNINAWNRCLNRLAQAVAHDKDHK